MKQKPAEKRGNTEHSTQVTGALIKKIQQENELIKRMASQLDKHVSLLHSFESDEGSKKLASKPLSDLFDELAELRSEKETKDESDIRIYKEIDILKRALVEGDKRYEYVSRKLKSEKAEKDESLILAEKLNEECRLLKECIGDMKKKESILSSTNESLADELEHKEAQAADLNKRLISQSDSLKGLRKELAGLKENICVIDNANKEVISTIYKKDDHIKELRKEIDDLKEKLKGKDRHYLTVIESNKHHFELRARRLIQAQTKEVLDLRMQIELLANRLKSAEQTDQDEGRPASIIIGKTDGSTESVKESDDEALELTLREITPIIESAIQHNDKKEDIITSLKSSGYDEKSIDLALNNINNINNKKN